MDNLINKGTTFSLIEKYIDKRHFNYRISHYIVNIEQEDLLFSNYICWKHFCTMLINSLDSWYYNGYDICEKFVCTTFYSFEWLEN